MKSSMASSKPLRGPILMRLQAVVLLACGDGADTDSTATTDSAPPTDDSATIDDSGDEGTPYIAYTAEQPISVFAVGAFGAYVAVCSVNHKIIEHPPAGESNALRLLTAPWDGGPVETEAVASYAADET